MKHRLSLGVLTVTLLTLGVTVSAQQSSSSSSAASSSKSSASAAQSTSRSSVSSLASSKSSSSASSDWRFATCPDGYRYRAYDDDGSQINYFADPCMNHYGVGSSSSITSCGPNPVLCSIGTKPLCGTDGEWTCVREAEEDDDLRITGLTPATGIKGSRVVIEGTGFARRGNMVLFGDSVIPNLRSLDGKHLVFRVPGKTLRPCYLRRHPGCQSSVRLYKPGKYDVSVLLKREQSNRLVFTLH